MYKTRITEKEKQYHIGEHNFELVEKVFSPTIVLSSSLNKHTAKLYSKSMLHVWMERREGERRQTLVKTPTPHSIATFARKRSSARRRSLKPGNWSSHRKNADFSSSKNRVTTAAGIFPSLIAAAKSAGTLSNALPASAITITASFLPSFPCSSSPPPPPWPPCPWPPPKDPPSEPPAIARRAKERSAERGRRRLREKEREKEGMDLEEENEDEEEDGGVKKERAIAIVAWCCPFSSLRLFFFFLLPLPLKRNRHRGSSDKY